MYNLLDYGDMTADRVRIDAYARALKKVIHPGDVVIDIGTGTGILSLLACRAGADRVYAIEPDHAIAVARENAAANGFAEQITFIQDVSARVVLPQPANVVVSDLHGVLPFFQSHLPTIIDARRRLLSPGGCLVPQRDLLIAALVSAPDLHAQHIGPLEVIGLDMRAARALTINTWSKVRFEPRQLLSEPFCWASLDYPTIEDAGIRAEFQLECSRDGTGHGFGIWFDSVLAEGVALSNAPGAAPLDYGHAYFPWPEPVHLVAGDAVHLNLQATLVHGDYIWSWDSKILKSQGDRAAKQGFSQSTFYAVPLNTNTLRKTAADHVPELSEDGEIARLVLTLMGDRRPLGEIAEKVAGQYPTRFPDWRSALNYVGGLSREFS